MDATAAPTPEERTLEDSRAFLERRDRLVRKLDRTAVERPRLYRARVVALALLGYGYVALLTLGLIAAGVITALVSPLLFAKLGLPLAVVALLLLRALWVRLPPPEGIRIRKPDAPELSALVEGLRRELRAPRVTILVDGAFSASVCQVPRLGLLGWHRNYLVLGLPLVQALPGDELRAVVAHELGHVSRAHGRLGGWIYRLRTTWARIADALSADGGLIARIFVRPFFGWFGPYFALSTLALARSHEYEADRAAAAAAGSDTFTRALVRTEIAGRFLAGQFWPDVYARCRSEAEPPHGVYHELAARVREAAGDADADAWVAAALREQRDPGDTHPTLRERLEALAPGASVPPVRPVVRSAADELLPDAARSSADTLSAEWRAAVIPDWNDLRTEELEARAALDDLRRRAQTGLSHEEEQTRAALVHRFEGAAAALPLYERLADRDPDDAVARFALGRLLLESGDEEGLGHLERAATLEPEAAPAAYGVAAEFLAARGAHREAAQYERRAREWGYVTALAHEERATLPEDARLEPHELPPEVLDALREELEAHDVVEGYVARRALQHLPDRHPVYVVGVARRERLLTLRRPKREAELVARLGEELSLPGPFWVVSLREGPAGLRRQFRRLRGARLVGRRRLTWPRSARFVTVPAVAAIVILSVIGLVAGADDRPAQRVGVDPASDIELQELDRRWAAEADRACAAVLRDERRAVAAARRRGMPTLVVAARVIRPRELRLLRRLAAIPYPTERTQTVFGLAAERLHTLNRAIAASREGRRRAARRLLTQWRNDARTAAAFRGIEAPACAAPPPAATAARR